MFRAVAGRADWPDFVWYPYRDFISGLEQPLVSGALGYTDAIRPNLTHEMRADGAAIAFVGTGRTRRSLRL